MHRQHQQLPWREWVDFCCCARWWPICCSCCRMFAAREETIITTTTTLMARRSEWPAVRPRRRRGGGGGSSWSWWWNAPRWIMRSIFHRCHIHITHHTSCSHHTHAERAQRQSRRNWHLHVAIRYHRVCIFGGRRNDSTPAISRAYTWQIDLEQNDLSLGNNLENDAQSQHQLHVANLTFHVAGLWHRTAYQPSPTKHEHERDHLWPRPWPCDCEKKPMMWISSTTTNTSPPPTVAVIAISGYYCWHSSIFWIHRCPQPYNNIDVRNMSTGSSGTNKKVQVLHHHHHHDCHHNLETATSLSHGDIIKVRILLGLTFHFFDTRGIKAHFSMWWALPEATTSKHDSFIDAPITHYYYNNL